MTGSLTKFSVYSFGRAKEEAEATFVGAQTLTDMMEKFLTEKHVI